MTILDFLLAAGMRPFSVALGLVFAFALIEVVLTLVGASLLGDGDGIEAGVDGPDLPDLDAPELELDFESAVAEAMEPGEAPETAAGTSGGTLAWLGFGEVPFLVWLAGTLTAFGLVGYGLQLSLTLGLDTMLPAVFAAALALLPGLALGGRFARAVARLLPKVETESVSRRRLGGRRGVLVQGTARAGMPAQARVRDRHGNDHYIRVEPWEADAEIPTGTDIVVFARKGDVFRALSIDDAEAILEKRRPA